MTDGYFRNLGNRVFMLPILDASFAGQQETFLNVQGLDDIKHAIKEVFAPLLNDRAIAYRVHQGFEHRHVALSAGIQRMVRSDLAASGVMFTLDTESGFRDVVFVTSSYSARDERVLVRRLIHPRPNWDPYAAASAASAASGALARGGRDRGQGDGDPARSPEPQRDGVAIHRGPVQDRVQAAPRPGPRTDAGGGRPPPSSPSLGRSSKGQSSSSPPSCSQL